MPKKLLNKINEFDPEITKNARNLGIYDEIAKKHESSGRCVFCNLKAKYVIYEYKGWALSVNLFPRSTGDLIVVPKRHLETYREMAPEDHLAMAYLNQLGIDLLDRGLNITGIYLLLRDGRGTDKTVKHLHGQVMNYWKGLIDWHPEEEILAPIEAAVRLREALNKEK